MTRATISRQRLRTCFFNANSRVLLAAKDTASPRRYTSSLVATQPPFSGPDACQEKLIVEWKTCKGRPVAKFPIRDGESLLDAARRKGVQLEGACDGSLACSTCHVVLQKGMKEVLGKPSEQEEDLLDLAHGLERESRLGCQVKLSELKSCTEPVVVKLVTLS